jgi:hypothetical protein
MKVRAGQASEGIGSGGPPDPRGVPMRALQ